jgi:hypothetical protein
MRISRTSCVRTFSRFPWLLSAVLTRNHVVRDVAELRFHGGEIVAVEAGMFKDVARHGLLALHLAEDASEPLS